MGLLDRFRSRPPEVRRETRIEFLGEQDGANERILKQALAEEFKHHSPVQRAYLARVGFAPSAPTSVALCIASRTGEDAALVNKILAIFARHAPKEVSLDILFLRAEQEPELAFVCEVFYVAAT